MASSELCTPPKDSRGYHVYKDIRNTTVGEWLQCARESGNSTNPYNAVAILKDGEVVRHVPWKPSRVCTLLLEQTDNFLYVVRPSAAVDVLKLR